jgi:hypothetical protein
LSECPKAERICKKEGKGKERKGRRRKEGKRAVQKTDASEKIRRSPRIFEKVLKL